MTDLSPQAQAIVDAYDNYTDKEYYQMCLMDWEARVWDV